MIKKVDLCCLRAYYTLFLILVSGSVLLSQNLDLRFKHLKVEDGLSQSTVRVIYQDRYGFMWFGTDIGVNKYDGNKITVYKYNTEDPDGIPSNFITDIYEDSYGKFWIGTTYNGLVLFDRKTEKFRNYTYDSNNFRSISHNYIRVIFEDSRRNVWIGTAGGGYNLYDRKTDSFIRFFHPVQEASVENGTSYISGITEDSNGFLWMGSPEGILIRYDPLTNSEKRYDLYSKNFTDRNTTTFGRIYCDSQDNIWVTSETGMYIFNQKTGKIEHLSKGINNKSLNENAVTNVLEIEKDFYMITTDHGGINLYNRKTGQFSYHKHDANEPTSISNDQVYRIYRSTDGIIWVGNYHGGVNIYEPRSKKFNQNKDINVLNRAEFSEGSVLTLFEDKDKRIWFGYDGQGIDIYDQKLKKLSHLDNTMNKNTIPSNNIVEIYQTRNGDMWIGTYLRGMCKIDGKTGKYSYYLSDPSNINSMGGNNVWTIIEDSQGKLWLGFQGNGVDLYDPIANRFAHYRMNRSDEFSLSNNDIYKILEDSHGNIWVGTRNGLCLYNRQKDNFIRFLPEVNSKTCIFGNCVYDIYQDKQGRLWIGTDQALNLFNPFNKTFEHFQEEDGLNGNAVLSITSDNNNNLWISTNKGISRFDFEQKKFRNYDNADGLLSNEFNYVSVLKASDGNIYFGGKRNFNFFHPDSIKDNPIVPPVYFTGLTILNAPIGPKDHPEILSAHINFTDKIVLNHDQSVITFTFAALNFSNPQKNQYAWKLEGFDDGWNSSGNKHEVTYTNLNPGKYVLKVIGSNNDGIWNEKGASLQVVMLPPWWKTIWFRALFYFSIIGLIILIYYIRGAIYQRQQKKLLVLVKERTFALEEVAVTLEEKQEEINSQNEKLLSQRDELESNNKILQEQKHQILEQNKELDMHRNRLESLIEERTRELREAKNKAEESDRLKSSFLANLSHEIRTPLNAILGFSSLLGEENISSEEREEFNRIIQGSSKTLLDLISDILDISKIEAGQLEISLQEVSLETVISDIVDIFNMFMKRDDIGSNKSVELKVAIDNNIRKVIIVTDELRLTQILSNLINNAIKFTAEGYVEAGCKKLQDSEMLEFYVKDTGIGIKEENQRMIFERFRKVEEDKTQLHRGTGLGLAISYQLVNLLGGSMRLTSELGKGSTFYFTLPFITSKSSYKPASVSKVTTEIPNLGKKLILVAEDDDSNFNYIEKLLKKANAEVLRAINGKQVITMLSKNPDIQLILLDIKMPVMDGIETIHRLRNSGKTIPVIAQTAFALAEEVVKLKKEGFDEYISKPIQREYLYAIITKFLF